MARLRLPRHFDSIGLGRPEIPVHKTWMARMRRPDSRPVCLQFGTERRGKQGARVKNCKQSGQGLRHENAFEREKGKKRFGVAAGMPCGFRFVQAADAAGAGFRRFLFAR